LQVSPLFVQLAHATPPIPQAVLLWVVQVVPLQQPFGQVEELQAGAVHAPEVQTWLVAVQSVQAAPLLPHWVLVSLPS
jgi:hypothetical protein